MAKTKQEINRTHDEWQRANTRRVVLKLNIRTDADIIETLEKQDSMQGYVKEAIRAYKK